MLFHIENVIEALIPPFVGVIQVTYSLFTRYEFGFFPAISMRRHSRLDVITGGFLASSPWIFRFADDTCHPYLLLGCFQLLLALFTRTHPQRRHHRNHGAQLHQ
jgi:hypothetical protein